MDHDLLAKYDRHVPRYTSYPPATRFHQGIGAASYRRWLEETPKDAALSIYLHIPYCENLCWFCGCHTKMVRRYEPIAAYLELLGREIDLIARILGERRRVHNVHWDGGTPGLYRESRGAPSAPGLFSGSGFRSPNQPDQERTAAYRDSSGPNSGSDAPRATIVGTRGEPFGKFPLTIVYE